VGSKVHKDDLKTVNSRVIARNTVLNVVGMGVPLCIAFVTMPILVRTCGTEQFGILTIAWMVIGYFSIFDLGLSRATTKFVSELIGKGQQDRISQVVWTSLTINVVLGIVAGCLLALGTPLFVNRAFKIDPVLSNDARTIFYILSAAVPVMLVSATTKGVLEAFQRFDLLNIVQIIAGSFMFLLPLAGFHYGLHLPAIIVALVIARFLFMLVLFRMCFSSAIGLKREYSFDRQMLRQLFAFGGWITVTNIVGPLLLYLDRFIIGTVISVAAVTYYSVPYEIVIRMMIFPTSMVSVLFPAFSSVGTESQEMISRLYTRSIKYLFLIMGPILLVIIVSSGEILRIWMGQAFAEKSAVVLQILSVGILLTPVQISLSLLQGVGRPDITAKFYVVELLLYIPLVYGMAQAGGIAGVALAWTIRAALDTILLIVATVKLFHLGMNDVVKHGLLRAIVVLFSLAAVFAAIMHSGLSPLKQIISTIPFLAIYAAIAWSYVMDTSDRSIISFGKFR
jgi:O-antigen/teichoic acid export membrane protein